MEGHEERLATEGVSDGESDTPTTPIRRCSTVMEDSDDELSEKHTLRRLAKRNATGNQSVMSKGSRRDSIMTPPAREDSVVSIVNRRTGTVVNIRSPGDIRKEAGKWAGVEHKGQFLGESVGEAGRFIPESPGLGFSRIPSQAFKHVRDNPAVVEQVVVRHHEHHDDEEEDDGCPICLGEEETDEFTVTNCEHRFHSRCILEYLRLRNRYQCPMCSVDIELLNLPDGEVLTQAALKDKFYAPAWDLKFKQHPDYALSFYTSTDEVKNLPLAVGQDEDRVWIQHCTFPVIVLQLVDSNGNDCQIEEGHDIDVVAQHLCPNAELFNSKVKAQGDGTAIFSNLVLHISRFETIEYDAVFPLRFQVRAPTSTHLPVHNKQVFAGVRFPDTLREGKVPASALADPPATTPPPTNTSPTAAPAPAPAPASRSSPAKIDQPEKFRGREAQKNAKQKQASCCGSGGCVVS